MFWREGRQKERRNKEIGSSKSFSMLLFLMLSQGICYSVQLGIIPNIRYKAIFVSRKFHEFKPSLSEGLIFLLASKCRQIHLFSNLF